MRINFKGKNGAVADALKTYAEKKVHKLTKYFHSVSIADLEQATERGLHIVELSVEGDGVFLRSEDRCNDAFAAVDNVVNKMERQIKRFKSKLRHDRLGHLLQRTPIEAKQRKVPRSAPATTSMVYAWWIQASKL